MDGARPIFVSCPDLERVKLPWRFQGTAAKDMQAGRDKGRGRVGDSLAYCIQQRPNQSQRFDCLLLKCSLSSQQSKGSLSGAVFGFSRRRGNLQEWTKKDNKRDNKTCFSLTHRFSNQGSIDRYCPQLLSNNLLSYLNKRFSQFKIIPFVNNVFHHWFLLIISIQLRYLQYRNSHALLYYRLLPPHQHQQPPLCLLCESSEPYICPAVNNDADQRCLFIYISLFLILPLFLIFFAAVTTLRVASPNRLPPSLPPLY